MERIADLALVVAANGWNLLLVGVFLARTKEAKRLERQFGLAAVALALPVAAVAFGNALLERPWWSVALPATIVTYSLVELILDYILQLDFRHTRALGPYLLLFYVAQWSAIGYGFAVAPVTGFLTLVTYFLCLAATGYSYSRVGHGAPGGMASASQRPE